MLLFPIVRLGEQKSLFILGAWTITEDVECFHRGKFLIKMLDDVFHEDIDTGMRSSDTQALNSHSHLLLSQARAMKRVAESMAPIH